MASMENDKTLNEVIWEALSRAGKDSSDASVLAVWKSMRDAYGEDNWTSDAELVATRVRVEVLARAK